MVQCIYRVLVTVACISSWAVRSSSGLCDSTLGSTKRLTSLPNVTLTPQPVAMRSNVCGLKASCCDSASINNALGIFERYDLHYDGLVESIIRVRTHLPEFVRSVVQLSSQYAFSYDNDPSWLYESAAKSLDRLFSNIDNQNILVRLNTLHNLFVGYYSGVLCSLCDPYQPLYFGPLEQERELGEADDQGLTLLMKKSMCTEMGKTLVQLVDMLRDFLVDQRNMEDMMAFIGTYCGSSGERFDQKSRFPRHGYSGCLAFSSDLQAFASLVKNSSVPLVSMLGCNSTETCSTLLCEQVLQGLNVNLDKFRDSMETFLQQQCQIHNLCDPSRLVPYARFFFPPQSVLEDLGWITVEGEVVHNSIVEGNNVTALSVWRFGCSNFLSRHACSYFPDITFTSTHFEGIIITCSILGVLLVLGLFILYKHFVLMCVKRSDLTGPSRLVSVNNKSPLLETTQSVHVN